EGGSHRRKIAGRRRRRLHAPVRAAGRSREGSRRPRPPDQRAIHVRDVRRPHRALSTKRPMTIRYPYKGHGLAGFDRISHSHSASQLIGWYRAMLRIRRIEEEIERRYHQDLMKTPIHLVIGQEAAAVGCCTALRATDLVYTSHRTHGAYLAKGGDLGRMLCEMHCRINGCVGSRGGSMHLIDKSVGMAGTSAIVGGAVPIAVGAAVEGQLKGEDRVVVVFIGDATTEEGVAAESLNFAALKKVPIVFFCENNFYSVQSPLATRQPPRDIQIG